MLNIEDNLTMRCPAAILVLAIAAPAAAQDNLILNPGFEDVTNGQPDHWTLRGSFWDDIEVSNVNPDLGAGHIRATNFMTDTVSSVGLSQRVGGVIPGTHYTFGFEYSKADFVLPAGDPAIPLSLFAPFSQLFVSWLDADENLITPPGLFDFINTADDPFNTYLLYQSQPLIAPADAAYASVSFQIYGGDESQIVYSVLDIDNVSFTAIPAPGTTAAIMGASMLSTRRKRL